METKICRFSDAVSPEGSLAVCNCVNEEPARHMRAAPCFGQPHFRLRRGFIVADLKTLGIGLKLVRCLPSNFIFMSTLMTHDTKRLKEDHVVKKNYISEPMEHKSCDAQRNSSERRSRCLPIRQTIPKSSSNNCFLQIYGTGFDTGETVATVLLFFDQQRFVFNVGEGLQRFCTQHRIKLSKIDHIFLTRICAETAGGLPGLLLTLAGINETGMTAQIWGPGEFQNLIKAIRCFVPNAATLHTHSFGGSDQMGGDEKVKADQLTPIVLLHNKLVKISSVILHPNGAKDLHTEKRSTKVSVVYICELAEVVGKFDPKKALAKGLKPGSKYGKLQRGESVLSDDGLQMVNPEDVMDASSPGPIMMLVDCPDLNYLDALVSIPSMHLYYSGSGKVVNCIVHLSPPAVANHEHYQDWMSKFNDAHHLMAGRHGRNPGLPILKSSASQLSKLNYICSDVFPITGFLQAEQQDLTDQQCLSKMKNTVSAENLLKFRLRPISALGVDNSSVPEKFSMLTAQAQFATDSKNVLEAKEYLSQTWKKIEDKGSGMKDIHDPEMVPECVLQGERNELEIIFLGTGSSQPSKYRNVSGIYLHLFEQGGILLDCGEGTYAQLKRRYGSEVADDILCNLKCIWISHIHADHHAGLPRLLSARKALVAGSQADSRVLVIGPRQLRVVLRAYETVEELAFVFLDSSQTTSDADIADEALKVNEKNRTSQDGEMVSSTSMEKGVASMDQTYKPMEDEGFHIQQGVDQAGQRTLRHTLHSMGLESLQSVQVVHCAHAFGVVIESQPKRNKQGNLRPGWKLVYSGDTRPCSALIDASHGATILIHEATFDDSMPLEAISKNHSITKEAIEVGMSAGVYRIILTHFSQRYPKIPVFDQSYTNKTCIAFDMMSVNLVDLPFLPSLLPALKTLFQDELSLEDDEDDLSD